MFTSGCGLELAQRRGEVGGKWAVDVGLKGGKVDLHHLVVFAALVGGEVRLERFGGGGDAAAARALEVVTHARGVGEDAATRKLRSMHNSGKNKVRNNVHLVVAPISAPMLQMVPMPVQESDSTPGP
jgi:hypothetical protein